MKYNEKSNKRVSVHIYGDSILRGVVLDAESGRYTTVKESDFRALSEKNADVVNRSHFGCTIERGAELISRALSEKNAGGGRPCEVMVLEYGGNDCDFDWRAVSERPGEEHLPATPLPRFRERLLSLVDALRRADIRPVLVSLPPIDADRYLERITSSVSGTDRERILSWLGDVQMIYRYQELYSAAITQTAYETGAAYVDLRTSFLDRHDYGMLLCADGIHPNERGHVLIRNAFAEASERILAPMCV